MNNITTQKGFTLVEIAIVLVIIGLLLGGVLKGQELIENSKIKAAKQDSDAIIAAIHGYQDRYRALPGDDLDADDRGADAAGDGDGLIEAAEQPDMWQNLRNDQFISGTGNTAPTNAFGGTVSVLSSAEGIVVCHTGLNAEQRDLVDIRFDDGAANTGIIESNDTTDADYDDAADTQICITY